MISVLSRELLAINKHGFGMKCSHTSHTLHHGLFLLLKPRNQKSREVFPLLQYPRGIITSTHNLGGLSAPREDYHLSLSWGIITPQNGLSPLTILGIITPYRGLSSLTILGDYHPLERIITSPLVDFGLLHQYVEKSDLLSIFGVLHPLPLFPTIILVQLLAFI